MVETKDANDVAENEVLSEPMVFTYAGNVSEKRQKKWASENIHRRLEKRC
jgi:hypothetical protein